jgi:hypothetical protein
MRSMPFDRGASRFGSLPRSFASDSPLCIRNFAVCRSCADRWVMLIAGGSSAGLMTAWGCMAAITSLHAFVMVKPPAQPISNHRLGVAACVLQVDIMPCVSTLLL